jgi:hypothetical protein
VAAVSPAAENLAIEAFLGVMVLLLAVSLTAVIRAPRTAGTTTAPPAGEASDAPGQSGSARGADAPAVSDLGASEVPKPAPKPVPGEQARARRGRYVARHGRGYVPKQRPEGPPWGPAETPPGQSSGRPRS